ncbi:MAG: DUF4159 domain-containing protein [Phycisphaerae bacterium]|nr:DUF4159 domain-containing protein [Phycisphaerae bacterium]
MQSAVSRGAAWLRTKQGGDGAWPQSGPAGGTTALCTLALLHTGATADDPAVKRGLAYLQTLPLERTYVVSLLCQTYAAAGPKYARPLANATKWLSEAQNSNGMWTYTKSRTRGGDNSNTQFALLGLHEANQASVPVSGRVWLRSRTHFLQSQNTDGGWGYTGKNQPSWGSMTAAGVASLYICGQRLLGGGNRRFVNGAYPDCGKYLRDRAVAKGIEWLAKHFSVSTNPQRGTWQLYWLYALERVGMLSGLRSVGQYDWYRAGAAELVAKQNPSGYWDSGGGQMIDTAFALLFLAKGNRPVLFQKVQWPGHWNRNLHDLENLTTHMGEKLGQRTTWQTTTLDLPLETLRVSPVLFITGHEFPDFTPEEKDKLRRFVNDAGGTLLFEACCGSKAFSEGFRRFAKEVWPNHPLTPLQADHPVYSTVYPLKTTYGLEGIDVGCRTGVFFSPKALSCLWELETIPSYSTLAFQLGTNLAAYATGGDRLRNKLDLVELPPVANDPHAKRRVEIPRNTIRIARLMHGGKYDVNPNAMTSLAELLRKKADVDVVAQERAVRATDKAIYEYPVVFMTGLYEFDMPEEDIRALREYLKKGGFLLVNNGCGRDAFRKSFRKFAKQLFPDHPLKPIPDDHPIYTGQTGVHLGEVLYRPYLAKEKGARGTTRPPLEQITLEGQTVVLYSPYDFGCALEGVKPYASRGYLQDSGRRLATAMFLFAISY